MQCADVLKYMSCSQPIDLSGWWKDKNAVSHVCGFSLILEAMAASLRRARS